MKTGKNHAWAEMCGAVIGAGFASGREIAAFFARYGVWSWLGVAAASAVMGWLCLGMMRSPGRAGMPDAWQGKWLGKVWQGLFAALLMAAGGAMLAGSGEVAALMLPFHGARALGLAASLALAWGLSSRENPWLGHISKGLVGCLVLMIALGLFLPARRAVLVDGRQGALLSGLCYGGFNMALAAPAAALTGRGLSHQEQNRCAALFTAVIAMLLACGNGVLQRHTALQGESLPFIMLLSGVGKVGYVLGGAALYLAALTTLTACIRGLDALWANGRWLWLPGLLLLSLGGLEDIVGVAYPLLGGACFVLLVMARCKIGTKA